MAITRKNREGAVVEDVEYRLSGRRSRIRIPSRSFHFSSSRYTSAALLPRIITVAYFPLGDKIDAIHLLTYNFPSNEIPRERERE